MANPDESYIPQLYGRRQSKPLKKRQAALMESLLPRLSVPDPEAGSIDLGALFPGKGAVELEIGFGGGEHLAAQATARPEVGFLGAEPFVNGVGKLLVHVADAGLANVRIQFGDARPLMEALPAASLSAVYVLFPDPWPKKRHFKRRIVSPWFFAEAARLLAPRGRLRVASDIPDYVRWTLMHAANAPDFEWTAERRADWTERPEGWPPTRYEQKAIAAGRAPAYLEFRRRVP
jgi:tRNA (guanine-N7-)-methyltransferase